MSAFTMRTRDAVEYLGGVVSFDNGLLKVEGNIGLSNYEIFDEAHREQLNSKILRTYWMWEIGVETAELWRFNMETSMSLIMPYYNQLYATEKMAFDPFKTIDIHTSAERGLIHTGSSSAEIDRTGSVSREQEQSDNKTRELDHSGSSSSETTQDGSNSSESRAVNSAFPQSQLAGNRDYATSATDSSSSGSSVANSDGSEENQFNDTETEEALKTGTESEQSNSNDKSNENNSATDAEESESRTSGYQGIASDLMLAFRQTILNLDQDIVNSLQDNFMGIWHDGSRYFDSYSIGRYVP